MMVSSRSGRPGPRNPDKGIAARSETAARLLGRSATRPDRYGTIPNQFMGNKKALPTPSGAEGFVASSICDSRAVGSKVKQNRKVIRSQGLRRTLLKGASIVPLAVRQSPHGFVFIGVTATWLRDSPRTIERLCRQKVRR
jgi:hypothetical protein